MIISMFRRGCPTTCLDIENSNGSNPLRMFTNVHGLIGNTSIKVVKLLIQLGVDPNNSRLNPLHLEIIRHYITFDEQETLDVRYSIFFSQSLCGKLLYTLENIEYTLLYPGW